MSRSHGSHVGMTLLLKGDECGKRQRVKLSLYILIFLCILNDYLDQLMLSSIIKDLMDPLLSVEYA